MLKKIKITMDATNAAFGDDPAREAGRILDGVAEQLQNGDEPIWLYDHNGNKVGEVSYTFE